MRLSSQSSQFVFNLPSDFIPQEIINSYSPILKKNWIQYENVVDYLNSTIKSVNYPGLQIETPEQKLVRGKVRSYKPAKNVQDILTTRDLQVTFRSVDSDLNYWICYDIFTKHYLDTEHLFINPFTLTAIDIWRDGIYNIRFFELIAIGMSENTFNYSQQKTQAKDFTMTFRFNFTDIEFLLNKSKVLELGSVPRIIQKI
jgi:hypothetical protein